MQENDRPAEKKLDFDRQVEIVMGWVENTELGDPRRGAVTGVLVLAGALETIQKTSASVKKTLTVATGENLSPSVNIDAILNDGAASLASEASVWIVAGSLQDEEYAAAVTDAKGLLDDGDSSATVLLQTVNDRLRKNGKIPLMFK